MSKKPTERRIELVYEPTPKQELLHKATARQVLYGGAAGGGKSRGMRWDGYAACLHNPGLDAYLFRRTRTQLETTHIKRVDAELGREIGHYNQKKNRFEFDCVTPKSHLNFCYAETEDDVNNYDSTEFHWLGIDEAQHFTEYQLSYLRTRMRIGDYRPVQPGMFPRLIMSANPGGISHHFLKCEFIDPAAPMTEFESPTMIDRNGHGWRSLFIPARMSDNPHLDEGYEAAFGGLPDWKRQMLVDGDWDVVPGAYFECFDRHLNVVRPFTLPDHLVRFMAMDGGFAYPFHIGWWAVMDGETRHPDGILFPRGALVCYREWYGCKRAKSGRALNVGLRMPPKTLAEGIMERERNDPPPSYRVADPAMWRSHGGKSQTELLAEHGVVLVKGDNERVAGWKRLYDLIDGSSETLGYRVPMMYWFDTCVETIRTLPALQGKETDLDDVEKAGEDHPGDQCRYAAMSRPLVRGRPKKVQPMAKPVTMDELVRRHDAIVAQRQRRAI